ncbi:hypothetical protein GC194_13425 [bacterium]|nr:hypothetical protein [bacterium]
MEKSIVKYLLAFCVVWLSGKLQAQQAEIFLGGQYSKPFSINRPVNFSDTEGKGLFARPGGGFTFEINSRKMFGLGGLFAYSGFGADYQALGASLKASSIEGRGLVGSTQFGLGPVANLPIIEKRVYFQLKAYTGFRAISVPDFVVYYSPQVSRFTQVEYKTNSQFSTFYQFGGAFQVFVNEKFGFSLGAEYLGGTVTTLSYKYLTKGSKIVEGHDSINQSIHYFSSKFGLVFLL